jgi:hypothetical protein
VAGITEVANLGVINITDKVAGSREKTFRVVVVIKERPFFNALLRYKNGTYSWYNGCF